MSASLQGGGIASGKSRLLFRYKCLSLDTQGPLLDFSNEDLDGGGVGSLVHL